MATRKYLVQIGDVVKSLFDKKGLSINKIVLFGSIVSKRMTAESDIDIIVVSKDFRGKDIFEKTELTSGLHRELVKQINKPVDIIYYSDIEWNHSNSLIIEAAKQEGTVVWG